MTTAGMAAARPIAVASSASAMPGATTARLVVCAFEMPMKLFMMPQTVPNSPTNGAVAPMVASRPVPRPAWRAAAWRIRSNTDSMRSLMPGASRPLDRVSSWSAARTRAAPAPRWRTLAPTASSSEPAACKLRSTSRVRRLAAASSRLLANHTVQVMTEAMARPIITAFTTQSASMNMPQGDRSRGSIAFSAASKPSGSANGSAAGAIAPSAWTGAAPSVGDAGSVAGVAAGTSAAGVSTDCAHTNPGVRVNAAIESAHSTARAWFSVRDINVRVARNLAYGAAETVGTANRGAHLSLYANASQYQLCRARPDPMVALMNESRGTIAP